MNHIFDDLIIRYPALTGVRESAEAATQMIIAAYEQQKKLLLAGNGGSCADAEHIAGELLKSFKIRRHIPAEEAALFAANFGSEGERLAAHLEPGLPCLTLNSHVGFLTAFSNDISADYAFAQQLYSQGRPGDVLLAISTSGNSSNIYQAMMTANMRGVKTILLTGNGHGRCENCADIVIAVPAIDPFQVQEFHLPVYHAICLAIEEHFYGK